MCSNPAPRSRREILTTLFQRVSVALSPPSHLALFRAIPLVPVALALMAGIQLGYSLPGPIYFGIIAIVVGMLLSKRWEVGLLVALLGIGWAIAPRYDDGSRYAAPLPTGPDLVLAVVRDIDLRPDADRLTLDLLAGPADSLHIGRGIWRRAPETGEQAASNADIWPGDTLILHAALAWSPAARNPNGFDYRYYLWTRHIDAQVMEPVRLVAHLPRQGWHPGRATAVVRQAIKARLQTWLGSPQAELLAGLLLGDKTGLDRETREQFQRAGVAHLLAVSGLHVGYIVVILLAVATLLRLPGWGRLAAILPFLAGYVLLTGASPSVLRAAIMAGLYLWGRALQRRPNTWNILAAAAIISVLIDPRSQFTPGFQLSFTAVAAILYLLPRLQASLKRTAIGEWLYAGTVRRLTTDLALLSISAQLGTMPLQALYFHILPIYGLVANLLVVPMAGMAVAAGFLALASAPLIGWVGEVFAQTAWLATTGIQYIITRLSTWPLGVVVTGHPGWALPAGLVIVLLGLPRLFTGEWRQRLFYLSAGGLLLANLALWPRVLAARELRVTVLDVGQGDAIHLSLPGREQLLIDFGPATERFDSGARVVGPYLKGLGITRLDGAVITHPHSDHIGGLSWLLENVPMDTLWDTDNTIRNGVYERVLALSDSLAVPRIIRRAGEVVARGKVDLLVLAPDSLQAADPGKENNASLVLLVRYGRTGILLMGDTEQESEWRLLSYGPVLAADWLKIGHHGAVTSGSRLFLEAVAPQGVAISVGRRNRFGHPAAETLARLAAVDSVHRTDRSGALVLASDGRNWRIVDWR